MPAQPRECASGATIANVASFVNSFFAFFDFFIFASIYRAFLGFFGGGAVAVVVHYHQKAPVKTATGNKTLYSCIIDFFHT